jgi:hypothetical protein
MNNLGRTGLSFEPNVGQAASGVDFIARTGTGTVFLTPTAAVFAMQQSAVSDPHSAGRPRTTGEAPDTSRNVALSMDLVGANPQARAAGVNPLPGTVNYFLGNDPARWHRHIPTYGRVEYPNVYPGVSLAYYGGPGGLEYDFTVSPGADPSAVALKFGGATGRELDARGDLLVHTAAGDLVQHAPVLYQEVGSQRQAIAGRFALDSGLVRFSVGPYDHSRPLVIDPLVLGYSTYLSGPVYGSDGERIAAGPDGSVYVAGVGGPDFPVTPGAFQTGFHGIQDGFVARLSPKGNGQADLLWATFLGGSAADDIHALAVDAQGNAYVAGPTQSKDFPTTPGAFQRKFGGGAFDGFAAKLSADGSTLEYGTYLGGSDDDRAEAIALDRSGSAYLTGRTFSPDFPTTPGAFQTAPQGNLDAFVSKLSADGTKLEYGTYLGGSDDDRGNGIAVDAVGAAYVTGSVQSTDFPTTPGSFQPVYAGGGDAFVTKLTPGGSALIYSTYLGGSQGTQNAVDSGSGVALDAGGNAYVAGVTTSTNFPTTPGAFQTNYGGGLFDAFVTKLAPGGDKLVYSTYLGGPSDDEAFAVATDTAGNACVSGSAGYGFPTTATALQKTFGGGQFDAFVTQVSPGGSALVYSTYLGGTHEDFSEGIAVDGSGDVYVTGETKSTNFPTTPGAFETGKPSGTEYTAFVTQFKPGPRPPSAQGLGPPSPTGAPGKMCCA